MPADVKERVLCRHCPEEITRPTEGKRWEDAQGSPACENGALKGDGKPILHMPMPAGFRGGAGTDEQE